MSPGTKEETVGLSHGTSSQEKGHRRRQSEPVGTDPNGKPRSVRGTGQHEDDLDLWQTTSPFASLARGLGGGLSQGLRTQDDRKKIRSVMIAEPKGK